MIRSHLEMKFFWTLLAGFLLVPILSAQTLHERIDQGISRTPDFAKLKGTPASDAEFLRRIYLDLAGHIPSAEEARTFLNDPSPEKRSRLVDRLLADEGYARHLALVFDVLWMDRRPDKHVKTQDWREYLRMSFAANKPYDQLVGEVLGADGSDLKNRAPARFYLDRNGEPHLITKDVTRLFLGMNLQCAQCHDHPLVDAYKQDHYYGVFAYLNRSYLFAEKGAKITVFAEKADGEVSFQSVFKAKVTKTIGPQIPHGPALAEPKFEKGQEYAKPAKAGDRARPKFSRRAELARALTSPENKYFSRSAVNRFWTLFMGRGIVYPVDYDHEGNPPSHPELLNLLAQEFASHKFDVKWLIRELVLSQTYQRSSEAPRGVKEVPAESFAVAQLRPLSPEQMAWSMMQATGLLEAERKTAKGNLAAVYAKLGGNIGPFITLFGNEPGTPADQGFEATLDQTLFLANGALVRGWLTARPGNLVDRLGKLKTSDEIAEEIYLSILTRLPSPEERKEVADFLARNQDRTAALPELAWALLASAEFRFNH